MTHQMEQGGWSTGLFKQQAFAVALALAAGSFLPAQDAWAHGAVAKPIARQYICQREYAAGNLSPVCRAVREAGGEYPIVQWHEYSANPAGMGKDFAEVQKVVPDGLLCAAGSDRKRAIDDVKGWPIQDVFLDSSGAMEVVWDAVVPHDPSRMRVFISKESHPVDQPLKWADLEELQLPANPSDPNPDLPGVPSPPIEAGTDYKTYSFRVKLPQSRSGRAVLYNYWQRTDAGDEGFFNCSDINIRRDVVVDPEFPWHEGEQYLPGFVPKVGEHVVFRVLDDSRGADHVNVSVEVTTSNVGNHKWAHEMAQKLNTPPSNQFVRIGVLRESKLKRKTPEIVFDSQNLAANHIWLKAGTISFFTIRDGGDPGEPGDKWNSGAVGSYVAGTILTGLDGNKYRCDVQAWCQQPVPAGWADQAWPYAAGSEAAHRENHPAWKPVDSGKKKDDKGKTRR